MAKVSIWFLVSDLDHPSPPFFKTSMFKYFGCIESAKQIPISDHTQTLRSTIHVKSGSQETASGSLIIPLDSAVFMVILEAPLFLGKHNFYLSTKPRFLSYPKRFWLIGSVQTKQEICAHLWVGLDRPYDCYKCSKPRVPILKMFRGI